MLNYVHGGDIQTYIDRHGFAPLDLSANINPFGIPDAVRAAMHRAVDNCMQYPDPFCRVARQAIGAREGVNPDFLYCGNGRRMCSTDWRRSETAQGTSHRTDLCGVRAHALRCGDSGA